MTKKRYITWQEVFTKLQRIDIPGSKIYGVPKGGMIAAGFLRNARNVFVPEDADIFLDDLVDSGNTERIYAERFPGIPFKALFTKGKEGIEKDTWIIFPWEKEHPMGEDNIQQNIVRQLQYIGEDPEREVLKETPNRIVKSWDKL